MNVHQHYLPSAPPLYPLLNPSSLWVPNPTTESTQSSLKPPEKLPLQYQYNPSHEDPPAYENFQPVLRYDYSNPPAYLPSYESLYSQFSDDAKALLKIEDFVNTSLETAFGIVEKNYKPKPLQQDRVRNPFLCEQYFSRQAFEIAEAPRPFWMKLLGFPRRYEVRRIEDYHSKIFPWALSDSLTFELIMNIFKGLANIVIHFINNRSVSQVQSGGSPSLATRKNTSIPSDRLQSPRHTSAIDETSDEENNDYRRAHTEGKSRRRDIKETTRKHASSETEQAPKQNDSGWKELFLGMGIVGVVVAIGVETIRLIQALAIRAKINDVEKLPMMQETKYLIDLTNEEVSKLNPRMKRLREAHFVLADMKPLNANIISSDLYSLGARINLFGALALIRYYWTSSPIGIRIGCIWAAASVTFSIVKTGLKWAARIDINARRAQDILNTGSRLLALESAHV